VHSGLNVPEIFQLLKEDYNALTKLKRRDFRTKDLGEKYPACGRFSCNKRRMRRKYY